MRRLKIRQLKISKKNFIKFIHLNFISGIVYAFYHFIRTPKSVDMPTRRLWAAETWIIFTLYSIFIYLFLVESDAGNGRPVFYELFRIQRYIEIKKSKRDIIKIFKFIIKHPDKYKFKTHKGAFPLDGVFGEPGSTFYTKEVFLGIPITLNFVTLETTKSSFKFKLIKPFKNYEIRGEFSIQDIQSDKFKLFLTIFSRNKSLLNHIGLSLIFVSPIRILVARQLKSELKFVSKLV